MARGRLLRAAHGLVCAARCPIHAGGPAGSVVLKNGLNGSTPVAHFCASIGRRCTCGLQGHSRSLASGASPDHFWIISGIAITSSAGLRPLPKSQGGVGCLSERARGARRQAQPRMHYACSSYVMEVGSGIGCRNRTAIGFRAPSQGAQTYVTDEFKTQRVRDQCTTKDYLLTRPRGSRQNRFSDRRLRGQVTTATPFRSRNGNRARSLSSIFS